MSCRVFCVLSGDFFWALLKGLLGNIVDVVLASGFLFLVIFYFGPFLRALLRIIIIQGYDGL